jgi:exopolysaccharide biosynthesis polyprenyl glycosylphosphotransferase
MFWGGTRATSGDIGVSSTGLETALSSPVGSTTRTHAGSAKGSGRLGRSRRTGSAPFDVAAEPLLDVVPVEDSDGVTRDAWLRTYQAILVLVDLLAATLAAVMGFVARFGTADASSGRAVDVAFGVSLPVAWVAAVGFSRAYEGRFVGVGSAEFERVFRAFIHLTVATVFISYLTQAPVARGYVVAALPLALSLDLVGRYAARKWLHRRRINGQYLTSVLAVGGIASVAQFTTMLRHDQHAGMRVVGACIPSDGPADALRTLETLGVAVHGDVDSIVEAARKSGAHCVAVIGGEISAEKLRWISWQLEGTDTDLIVSPGLTEVGGRRLHIQPVAGLPMLHVDEPEFNGFRRMLKGAFDRVVAGCALVLLAPLLLGIGLVVRLTSRGPALFTQTRVGRHGNTFRMVKFRSMCVDAESQLVTLGEHNESAGLLFKIRKDPRVTPVGRVLRRLSLDELPQLLNVVMGSMSLVGPRPPLPAEVSNYQDDVRRRLLVKPGLTGLWQISGRSDLSWEESVRLDLRYVENWSLALDMVVLWKTVRAVFRAEGAY